MEFSRIFKRISFPNRDIEKRVAFSGIINLSPRSPKWSPRSYFTMKTYILDVEDFSTVFTFTWKKLFLAMNAK
ncbi:hypothetical protein AVEN_85475-1 [Araneus ventricosus]|uniref:Uncharacterized protein n=1 Tax=Araneus ventricosus TaxID=182803 RepID=A0A4Y2TWP0_ARAVE|nr:hypothetical protein AVEN_85475-1 [Araneus ventricosus]